MSGTLNAAELGVETDQRVGLESTTVEHTRNAQSMQGLTDVFFGDSRETILKKGGDLGVGGDTGASECGEDALGKDGRKGSEGQGGMMEVES